MKSETNPSIFINYRRLHSASDAKLISNELQAHFGAGSVFLDTENIMPGDYWAQKIKHHLAEARVLLVLIHANWLHAQHPESGQRCLDLEWDWVRLEIAHFLAEGKTIIPILLEEGTPFPKKEYLPEPLKGLTQHQHPCRLRMDYLKDDIASVVRAIAARGIAQVKTPPLEQPYSLDETHPLPPLSLAEARALLPAPYVGLRHFEEREAHLYFGRDEAIARLINLIGQPGYRLFLLYGPSGVGKSSLLNAGLLPRIRQQYTVYGPVRRSFEQGLDAQLQQLLAQTRQQPGSKPTLLILDQVEEMFTHANPERRQEAADFFRELAQALRDEAAPLRILLSFRFEHFTKIAQPLEDAGLQWLKLGLEPLTPRAVRQAIIGVMQREPLPQLFKLHITPELIEAMTAAVCRDEASHIAPLLELQLRSMWDEAVQLHPPNPVFDKTLYMRFETIALPQMVAHQLQKLPEDWQPAVENGLVLGLLRRLVTPRGTAGSAPAEELRALYRHIEHFDTLLERLQDTYLLIALPHEQRYRLAHDALAPIIQQMHQDSDLPGQRAERIIEAKARDYERGYPVAFSEVDLEIVRAGQAGMAAINDGLLAQLEQDEQRYRAERLERFRMAFDAAEKAFEHLDFPKVLKSLQVAAGYGIEQARLFPLAADLPCVFNWLGQAEALEQSRQLAQQIQALPATGHADGHTSPSDHLRARFFPTLLPIPGGTYAMGSTEGYKDERPVHEVAISTFLLAETPVTCWQYGLFCLLTGRDLSGDSGFGRGDKPVINITWFDAVEYCNWLSEREGLQRVYEVDGEEVTADWTADGYRLPTEAEWEYAAGGGAKKRTRFGNGKDLADPAEINFDASHPYNDNKPEWYIKGKGRGATTPVRQFDPNALGLYDMSGNVYEWCWDWWSEGSDSYYEQCEGKGQVTDPTGPESGDYRVVRGGSWLVIASNCRASYRYRVIPIDRVNNLGFRVSRRPVHP